MEITDENWSTLIKRLDRIEQSQNNDRTDIDDISTNVKTVLDKEEKLMGRVIRLEGKVFDAVEDATNKAVKPLNEKMDVFVDKEVLPVTEKQSKKLNMLQRFWKKVGRWK